MKRLVQIFATAVLIVGNLVHAAEWPTKTITFFQPYGPGTNLDSITRFLAERMGTEFKVPIVVENKAGANGVIGTEMVARMPADGYTFLFTGPGHFTNEVLMSKVPFDPIKDFKPVARLASVMLVLVVPKASPFNSVKDIVEYAKKNPGKVSYASAGSGSAQHLSAAGFSAATGVSLLHVPYKTQAQATTDTIGGQVDFTFAALTTAGAQIKAGNLRALAVTGPRRTQSLPDLPTVAESGYPGYEFFSFNAVFVSAATPDEIVRKFSDSLAVLVKTPRFLELSRLQGFEIDFADSTAWAAMMTSERKKWADLIRTSGAKLE
ncbi:tripartite tricarboxylate transporter substrate binding protein [Limnohabitans sp. Rim8]|uniref:Bug family tripartite tricarboxylate transporter substrate binding protein n=1 Tax=Limnohabitans sp. Rim8 TaxID=1100718 RepID=UPI003306724B